MNPNILSESEVAAIISKLTSHIAGCAQNEILRDTGLRTARTLESFGNTMARAVEEDNSEALETAVHLMSSIAEETRLEESGLMPATHAGGMLQ